MLCVGGDIIYTQTMIVHSMKDNKNYQDLYVYQERQTENESLRSYGTVHVSLTLKDKDLCQAFTLVVGVAISEALSASWRSLDALGDIVQ